MTGRQTQRHLLLSVAVLLVSWRQVECFTTTTTGGSSTFTRPFVVNHEHGLAQITRIQQQQLRILDSSSSLSMAALMIEEAQVAVVLPAKRRRTKKVGGAPITRNPDLFTGRSMWQHDLLTKQQELELGRQVQRAMEYQTKLVEYYHLYLQQQQRRRNSVTKTTATTTSKPSRKKTSTKKKTKKNDDDDSYWGTNEDDSILGGKRRRSASSEQEYNEDLVNLSIYGGGRLEDLTEEASWTRAEGEEEQDWGSTSRKPKRKKVVAAPPQQPISSSLKKSTSNEKDWDRKTSLAILKGIPDQVLVDKFGATRAEIKDALARGSVARETLIRSNVRLVVNLAKQWSRQQHKSSNTENMYHGGWDRPSLDEAIQEGILGLAKAADRFEPQRNLRFSTYATLWVTSQIRKCFQKHSTPGMSVPSALLDQKSRFKKLLKQYHDAGIPIPSVPDLAREMGLSLKKLEWVLLKTRPAVSTDQPAGISGQSATTWAGKAGNTEPNDPSNVLGLNLVDPVDVGKSPYFAIEWNWLRQSLENAMASELVPYERDILRLRLGLDDGVSRTVPQVVQAMSSAGALFTASQVRSAEARAYRKLRAPKVVQTYQLLAYLDICGIDKADCTKTKGLRL